LKLKKRKEGLKGIGIFKVGSGIWVPSLGRRKFSLGWGGEATRFPVHPLHKRGKGAANYLPGWRPRKNRPVNAGTGREAALLRHGRRASGYFERGENVETGFG